MTLNCTIVNYGSGNLFSVAQALKRCGVEPILSSDPETISQADRLILPGVGAFGRAVERLRETGLEEGILRYLQRERPFLGICVGMQVLMDSGEEFGRHKGLGVFRGKVARIGACDAEDNPVRVPVIGWNTPRPARPDIVDGTPFASVAKNAAFYFVHSFAVQCENEDEVIAVTEVGNAQVTAAIGRDHIFGVQFHPERSATDGQAFLEGFLRF